MAPETDPQKKMLLAEKLLTLGPVCSKAEKVPASFVSLTSAEERFGVSVKVRIYKGGMNLNLCIC